MDGLTVWGSSTVSIGEKAVSIWDDGWASILIVLPVAVGKGALVVWVAGGETNTWEFDPDW